MVLMTGCFTPVAEPDLDAGLTIRRTDAGIAAPAIPEIDAGGIDAGEVDAGEPDAGEPDAGEADAGIVDGGVPDAGLPVCARPSGSCANARTGTCTLSGRCDGSTAIKSLTCSNNTCTCRDGVLVTNTVSVPPDLCTTPGGLEAHWNCTCGWATPVTPTCGAGGLGSPCPGGGGCQGGVCINRNGEPRYCSAECYLSCPCGFTCVSYFGLAYCEP